MKTSVGHSIFGKRKGSFAMNYRGFSSENEGAGLGINHAYIEAPSAVHEVWIRHNPAYVMARIFEFNGLTGGDTQAVIRSRERQRATLVTASRGPELARYRSMIEARSLPLAALTMSDALRRCETLLGLPFHLF
jgi:hypothetical protein